MALVAGVFAWIYYRRGTARQAGANVATDVPIRNPFSLTSAAKFAVFFAAVLLIVKFAQQNLPARSIYVVAALAGLADVDAIALSMAESARCGNADVAVNAIVVAALTNTLVKSGMVVMLAAPPLKPPVLVASAAILATGLGIIFSPNPESLIPHHWITCVRWIRLPSGSQKWTARSPAVLALMVPSNSTPSAFNRSTSL